MRKAILYAAMSLDGYLADEQGGLAWLEGDGSGEDRTAQWYEAFYDKVDCILMGRKTYQQITTELSPEVWMYGGKQSYVFTQQVQDPLPDITFTQRKPAELLRYLKHRKGKDIWICGGATLIEEMQREDLIDEYHLTLVPRLLGKGIPLFLPQNAGAALTLVACEQGNGMVDLIYRKREVEP